METAIALVLIGIFGLSDHVADPIQAAWWGRQEIRQLDCERIDQAEAHRRYPAKVPETAMRTQTQMQLDALVCERRVVRFGVRNARDEVILTSLGDQVQGIAEAARALSPANTRFVVDAYYPQPQVAQKIAVATRQALAVAGSSVSSQVPPLAAGDVDVLQGLTLQEALPMACARLTREGSVAAGDAFVAVALLRPQETQLHGGLCVDGSWRWLQ